MRNLAEYPITKQEVLETLSKCIAEQQADCGGAQMACIHAAMLLVARHWLDGDTLEQMLEKITPENIHEEF